MIKKIILDDKYEIGLGFNIWARSKEPFYVKEGTIRRIGGVIMRARTIIPASFFYNLVSWVPMDEELCTIENLTEWINNV